MASTVSNGSDRSEKWQQPFQMATSVYEREIGYGDVDKKRHLKIRSFTS